MPRASGSLLSHRQHLVVVTTTDSSTTLIVLDLVGIFVFAIAGGLVADARAWTSSACWCSPVRRVSAAGSSATC